MFHLSEDLENRIAPAPASQPGPCVEDGEGSTACTGDDVRFFEKLQTVEPMRRRKLIRLREAIRGGTYLTDDKLRTALDRLKNKDL